MKRIFTLSLLLALAIGTQAQTFRTHPATSSISGSSEEFELVLHAFIVNENASDSAFTWKRIVNDLEAGWQAAICDDITCWAPTVDSNTLTISQGDSSILDAHFYLNNTVGSGLIRIMVWSGSDVENADTIEYMADTWALFAANIRPDKPMKIFPNPTSGMLHLEFKSEGTVQIEVFDVLGKKMSDLQYEGEHSSFDLSTLPNGLYIIRVTENGQVYSRTFRKAN
ncbi:MAG: T9SS type A sorting domain-containing protein [Bacteroidota bacterium]|nr:T9SS type A sorting domain-containing protein [Bacteroidota bacterium]MDX5430406.1 T9SS type A sorting domain-containing protein [Bacteroidota bacterium]MDX5469165.1 T9SS type A sorting domain-containing protein [Bacteroidota bacterium]